MASTAAVKAQREAEHGQVAVSFHKFDADDSGFLDEGEIGAFCKKLGLLLSAAEVQQALSEMESGVDDTQDGKVDFEEFNNWWSSDSQTKKSGSLAFRMQQAKDKAFGAELKSPDSPMGRLIAQKAAREEEAKQGAGTAAAAAEEGVPNEPEPEPDAALIGATLVEVEVPAGCGPGDLIAIETEHGEIEIEIADGLAPGDLFEVALGSEPEPEPEPEPEKVHQNPHFKKAGKGKDGGSGCCASRPS